MRVTSELLFLLISITSSNDGLVSGSNSTEDPCSRFKECWQCVESPCSRTNEAEERNNICVWCNNYPGEGKACISSIRDTECIDPMKYTYQCSDPTAEVVSKELNTNCEPVIGKGFIVHLEQLSEDVQGVITAIIGIQGFRVWIGMCRYVNSSEITNTCGQHAPIEMIEMDSRLNTPPPWTPDNCWNVGELGSENPSLVDETDPESGILLNYGSTPCCAGNLSLTSVIVVLKPGWCQGGIMKTSVTSGNPRLLTNCTAQQSLNKFVVEVTSSTVCHNNVEWQLSTTNSTVFCNMRNIEHLQCNISLSPKASGRQSTSSYNYCQQRFQLWVTFVNRSEAKMPISGITRAGESCRFLLNSADISNLSIVYIYPTALPSRLLINGKTVLFLRSPNSDESNHATVVAIIVVLVIVLATVLIVPVFILYKKKHNLICFAKGYNPISDSKDWQPVKSDSSLKPESRPTAGSKMTMAGESQRLLATPDDGQDHTIRSRPVDKDDQSIPNSGSESSADHQFQRSPNFGGSIGNDGGNGTTNNTHFYEIKAKSVIISSQGCSINNTKRFYPIEAQQKTFQVLNTANDSRNGDNSDRQ